LVKAAKDCGMDSELVRRRLAGDDDIDRIAGAANAAKEAGIDGVPTFIFDSRLAVSGAQPPELLASAITRAADERPQ
jgi:predicted DsbA family dithiol-disulfide isomerase